MMHNNLISYYERLFAIKQYHGWNLNEIENLLPWELDVVTSLISNYIEKIEADRKQAMLDRSV